MPEENKEIEEGNTELKLAFAELVEAEKNNTNTQLALSELAEMIAGYRNNSKCLL